MNMRTSKYLYITWKPNIQHSIKGGKCVYQLSACNVRLHVTTLNGSNTAPIKNTQLHHSKPSKRGLFCPLLPDFRTSTVFGRFPGFARLPFWQQQHVDEDEYVALVERQKETEVLEEETSPTVN
jgi:hypothetical protein